MVHFKLCGILIFFYNFSTEFFLEINFCLWLFYRERSREKPLGITLHEIPVPLPPGSVPSTGILWKVLWVEVPLWRLFWVTYSVSTAPEIVTLFTFFKSPLFNKCKMYLINRS